MAFNSLVRLRNARLHKLLQTWRQQFEAAFHCDTLTALSLPNTSFYNKKAPADILPEVKKQQQSKNTTHVAAEHTKSGKSKHKAEWTCAQWLVDNVTVTEVLEAAQQTPQVDGKQVCFAFCLLQGAGCRFGVTCKRTHIDLEKNRASWTRTRLQQLTTFFNHPSVKDKLQTSSWYNNATGAPRIANNAPPANQQHQPRP
jgi:hypothetical protein